MFVKDAQPRATAFSAVGEALLLFVVVVHIYLVDVYL
jgi:hypothetical protein